MQRLFFVLFILIFTNCFVPNKKTPLAIELESIEEVFLTQKFNGKDTVILSKEQIEQVINQWNNSESEGMYKMMTQFWLGIKLKNDSVRTFRINNQLMKEHGDWAFSISDTTIFNTIWESKNRFLKISDFTPLSFINTICKTKQPFGKTFFGDFPENWVKEEHLDSLFQLIYSKDTCSCYINAYSSYIPSASSEKGGFARAFIELYRKNGQINFGHTLCPIVDNKLNYELRMWWKEMNLDTNRLFVVDDYPVKNEKFDENYGTTKSGELVSFDRVWFSNRELNQSLVIELYTDYHRLVISHFDNENIPKEMINRMGFNLENGEIASFDQKIKDFNGFIPLSQKLDKNLFVSLKGISIGMDKSKAIEIYGKPDTTELANGIEILEWEFQGDVFFEAKLDDQKKMIARDSYGHSVTMFFEKDKLIAQILFNDIP